MNAKYDGVPVAVKETTLMERILDKLGDVKLETETNLVRLNGIRRRALGDSYAVEEETKGTEPHDPSSAFSNLECVSNELCTLTQRIREQISEIERAI